VAQWTRTANLKVPYQSNGQEYHLVSRARAIANCDSDLAARSLCKTMLFKFACYFPAENPLFIAINVESDAWVEELLLAIRARLQEHRRKIDPDDLRLFKVKLFFLWQTANY
jgi:hypothetical protein